MAISLMLPRIPDCIAGQQLAHKFRDSLVPTGNQKMNRITHQDPSENRGPCFLNQWTYPKEEILPVLVIVKDLSPFDSTNHDMVQNLRSIQNLVCRGINTSYQIFG